MVPLEVMRWSWAGLTVEHGPSNYILCSHGSVQSSTVSSPMAKRDAAMVCLIFGLGSVSWAEAVVSIVIGAPSSCHSKSVYTGVNGEETGHEVRIAIVRLYIFQ